MTNQPKKTGSWSAVRQHLNAWNKTAMLALVKDLYGLSPMSRDFIVARTQGDDSGAIIEKYRKKIIDHFFPARGDGKLKLGEARKDIRDYRKATGNIAGTVELLMTYVETGTRFTQEYGDIDERFYSSIESALGELSGLFRDEARELYPKYHERLDDIVDMSDGIGWGFHDYIMEIVCDLEVELEE